MASISNDLLVYVIKKIKQSRLVYFPNGIFML
jgi:hypothetical protein